MRDHSRAQATTTNRKQREHRSIRGYGDHSTKAFVSMSCAKQQRRRDDADPDIAAAQRRKLLQHVAAEDKFLDDSRGCAKNDPDADLREILRRNGDDGVSRLQEMKDAKQESDGREYGDGDDPEDECRCDVGKDATDSATFDAEDFAQRCSAQAKAPEGDQCQHALPGNGEGVLPDAAFTEAMQFRLMAAEDGDSEDDDDEQRGMPPGRDGLRAIGPGDGGRGWCVGGVL